MSYKNCAVIEFSDALQILLSFFAVPNSSLICHFPYFNFIKFLLFLIFLFNFIVLRFVNLYFHKFVSLMFVVQFNIFCGSGLFINFYINLFLFFIYLLHL